MGTLTGYGIGQLGAQIFRDTPAVLLPIFMTTILGVPAWLAGIAILIPKLWVILCDPLVGVWSDRLKPTRGRTPFLFWGALLTGLGFAALFVVTDYGSPWLAAGAVCLLFLLASTGFSVYSVPYLAVASELSADSHERTRILAYRMVATIGGVILGVGVAQPLVFALGGGPHGWHVMAFSFALVCLLSMALPAFALRRVPLLEGDAAPAKLLHQMKPVLANKPYLVLLATSFVQGIGQASGYTVIGFFYLYALGEVDLIPKFVLVMATGSMVSQPLFLWLSRNFGKVPVYWVASILWTLITISWFYVYAGSPVLFELPLLGRLTEQGALVLVRAFLIGITNTGFLLLSLSMLTDTVEYQRRRFGVANEGVFSGIWSAAEKLAFAMGPLVAGFVMSFYGFQSSNTGAVAQSAGAITGIKLLYSYIPAGTQVLSLIVFSRYRLDPSLIGEGARMEPAPAVEASEAGLHS
ncbi:MFS transporter [Novosphingobium sp. PC22D]|nr:MFS transporter [Novosphingobium sp. PC22D]